MLDGGRLLEAAKLAGLAHAEAVPDDHGARAAYQDTNADTIAALEAEALGAALVRTGFGPVVDVARGLAAVPARWAVHGGWALDLATRAPSRHHGDVDVAVAAADAAALLDALTQGGARVAWLPADEPAAYVPHHPGEAHPGGGHQAVGGVGVPILAPEAALLFKAAAGGRSAPRPKDDADHARALPSLDADVRAWLGAALPADHPWRGRLAATAT